MSFYDTTKTKIKEFEPGREYPIGTVVRYKNNYIEICGIGEVNIRSQIGFCRDSCALYEYCIRKDIPVHPTDVRCSRSYRSDKEMIYYKVINNGIL